MTWCPIGLCLLYLVLTGKKESKGFYPTVIASSQIQESRDIGEHGEVDTSAGVPRMPINPLIATGSGQSVGSMDPKPAFYANQRPSAAQSLSNGTNMGADSMQEDAMNSCQRASLANLQRGPQAEGQFVRAGRDTLLYSAYYDEREVEEARHVRMPGVSATNITVYCHLWWDDDKQVEADVALVKPLVHWHYE